VYGPFGVGTGEGGGTLPAASPEEDGHGDEDGQSDDPGDDVGRAVEVVGDALPLPPTAYPAIPWAAVQGMHPASV
jgi:hypothetical protein